MNRIKRNIISSLVLQVCNIVSALIIPRMILGVFGSNVNGLIASITQFTNYVALLEGGVSSVMMANLYKPLFDKDDKKLSAVFATMNKFYRQISCIFLVYQIILAIFYPLIVHSGFDWGYVFTLTLILGINNFVQYTFSVSCKLLLEADNKIYITKGISIVVVVLNTVITYVTIKVFPNIHIVKLFSAIVYTLQPLVYNEYINKKYRIDKQATPDESTIKQRWNGLGINIAYFVHNNTDVVVLTFFTSILFVSVYNINMIVVNGIRTLVIAFLSSFIPLLGKKLVANNDKDLHAYFERYEFITFFVASIAFSLGVALINPFLRIYTSGVNDADYIQPYFSCIILMSEWVYCIRDPYVQLAYQSNRFKEISKYAYGEAVINIVISLSLVNSLGLLGVAIGTLSAMMFRAICQLKYAKKLLPCFHYNFAKYMCGFCLAGISSNLIIHNLQLYNKDGLAQFLLLVISSLGITCSFFCIAAYILNKPQLIRLINDSVLIRRRERRDE